MKIVDLNKSIWEATVQREMQKNGTNTMSEHEHDVMKDVMMWGLKNSLTFGSLEEMVRAYWNERLE